MDIIHLGTNASIGFPINVFGLPLYRGLLHLQTRTERLAYRMLQFSRATKWPTSCIFCKHFSSLLRDDASFIVFSNRFGWIFPSSSHVVIFTFILWFLICSQFFVWEGSHTKDKNVTDSVLKEMSWQVIPRKTVAPFLNYTWKSACTVLFYRFWFKQFYERFFVRYSMAAVLRGCENDWADV